MGAGRRPEARDRWLAKAVTKLLQTQVALEEATANRTPKGGADGGLKSINDKIAAAHTVKECSNLIQKLPTTIGSCRSGREHWEEN